MCRASDDPEGILSEITHMPKDKFTHFHSYVWDTAFEIWNRKGACLGEGGVELTDGKWTQIHFNIIWNVWTCHNKTHYFVLCIVVGLSFGKDSPQIII